MLSESQQSIAISDNEISSTDMNRKKSFQRESVEVYCVHDLRLKFETRNKTLQKRLLGLSTEISNRT